MTRKLLFLLLTAAVALNAAAADRFRYIVVTNSEPHAARVRMVDDDGQVDAHRVRAFRHVNGFAADLTEEEAAALQKSAGVRYVRRVVERHLADAVPGPQLGAVPDVVPSSDVQTVPWGIDLVHAPAVWSLTKGRGTVNVVVLDTGIDATHPDVGPNVVGGYDVLTKTGDIFDDNGHGTHVAGTIAALDNGMGVVGVAPQARLWSVKVLGADGNGSDETVVAGVDKVLDWKHAIGGHWIVSMSIGASDPSDLEKAAFDQLAAEGVLAIAAAGNRGLPALDYPGGYPAVMAVGAIGSDQVLASFSSFGNNLAVVAPGVKVLSTVPRGTAITSAARVDGSSWLNGFPFTGAPKQELHAQFVAQGLGRPEDFTSAVQGKIALMQRGEITFAEKVRNAVAAGAVGAIVYNNDDTDPRDWTLYRLDCGSSGQACGPFQDDVDFAWPVSIGLTKADGEALLAQSGGSVTIGTWSDDYKTLNGTSMATPHVSGIAALLWAMRPNLGANDIRNAITSTAHDLGPGGYDPQYGYGLVDAQAAARLIAPAGPIASPPPSAPPPQQPPHRRATH